MEERDYFNEKQESKKATFSCPHCRDRSEYDVRWLKRTKKASLPRGARAPRGGLVPFPNAGTVLRPAS